MARRPTNEYMPDFGDEPHSVNKDNVSLNNSASSPFHISSHIIDMTKKFNEEKSKNIKDIWTIDWQKNIDNSFFIPENRWTYEVVRQPIYIKDNLYKIVLDADIYIDKHYINNNIFFEFISRTLYPYIDKSYVEDLNNNNENYFNFTYYWIIRWLPKNKSKLTFYTTEEIEKNIYIKTNKFEIIIDNDEIHNVKVPFIINKNIIDNLVFFKHDSDILYMEVESW